MHQWEIDAHTSASSKLKCRYTFNTMKKKINTENKELLFSQSHITIVPVFMGKRDQKMDSSLIYSHSVNIHDKYMHVQCKNLHS